MAERKEQPADPRDLQELYAAFEAVDNVVLKNTSRSSRRHHAFPSAMN